jgi:hypothetical protein
MVDLEIGDPLLARGDLLNDARYGIAEIVEVSRKYVWYKINGRTHQTSKDRALRMFEHGTAFPPLEGNKERRWSHF